MEWKLPLTASLPTKRPDPSPLCPISFCTTSNPPPRSSPLSMLNCKALSSPICNSQAPVWGLAEGRKKRKTKMRTDSRSNCSPISFLWWGGATQSQSLDGKGRRDKDDWFEEVRRLLSILTTLATVQCSAVQCSAVCHLDFGEDQSFHIFIGHFISTV